MKTERLLTIFVLLYSVFCNKQDIGYQVALLIDGVKFCSGTLITEHVVITAASCVYKAFEVDVILGVTNLLKTAPVTYIATSFIIHENFTNENILENNIALIKIPKLNQKYAITTVKLQPMEIKDGDCLVVSGFNLQNQNYPIFGLQPVIVSLVSSGKQEKYYCMVANITSGSINYGNSGSSVLYNNCLGGILVNVGNNETCAVTLAPFISWIQSHTMD